MQLSICTVSFNSYSLIELNRRLVSHLNPNEAPIWWIAENSPSDSVERYPNWVSSPTLNILPGTAFDPNAPRPASYHHASALHTLLPKVTTRYLLVLDPDFYIIYPNWIQKLVGAMQQENWAFAGVPWNPRWSGKYRHFPCVHCMLIDLKQVEVVALDFHPAGIERPITQLIGSQIPDYKVYIFVYLLKSLLGLYKRPQFIGKTRDTGYKVHARFANNPNTTAKTLTPVFQPATSDVFPPGKISGILRAVDHILPESYQVISTRPNSYSEVGLKELAGVDTLQYGWEEFLWDGEPFGFHVRGQQQPSTADARPLTRLEAVLTQLTGLTPDHLAEVRVLPTADQTPKGQS
jgi:hypothetical protein